MQGARCKQRNKIPRRIQIARCKIQKQSAGLPVGENTNTVMSDKEKENTRYKKRFRVAGCGLQVKM